MIKTSLCLLLLLACSIVRAASVQTLSLSFEKTPVEKVFACLAAAKKLNLVIAPNIDTKVTLQLTDVTWESASRIVQDLADVHAVQKGNILYVSQRANKKTLSGEDIDLMASSPVTTAKKVFFLQFISAVELGKKLSALPTGGLSRHGKLAIDAELQSLTIWDTPESLSRVTEWIRNQDIVQPQIEIAAQMISISQDNLRELGISWHTTTPDIQSERALQHFSTINLAVPSPSLSAGIAVIQRNSQLLFLELSALEYENQIEIIASPRLMTSQGRTASIKQGTEIPYQTVSGKNENPIIDFKEAVLGMEVTPQRVGSKHIRLQLKLSQNVPGKVLQGEGKGPPSIDKQEISTEVVVADGQTVALGGIFQQQKHQGMTKAPWLSDIPLLGLLFRQQSRQQQKRELVIFITPRLLHLRNISEYPIRSSFDVDVTD